MSADNYSEPEGNETRGNDTPRDVPELWSWSTVGNLCTVFAGYGFPKHLQGSVTGEIPFFKVGDISEYWRQNLRYLTDANHHLSAQGAQSLNATPLPSNTTVFAKIGAAIGLNRRAMLSKASLVDNNVMGLYPSPSALHPVLLFYFMCTVKLAETARATTVPSVRKSDVEDIPFPLPPLAEQRRIVAEIETQFTRLDASVAALRRARANLKRYRASVLKDACEGRLVPAEAELARSEGRDYEPATVLLERILAERRARWESREKKRGKYKEPSAPDTSALPELPEGWVWATVAQMASLEFNAITDGPFGSNLKTSHYTDAGPRVIRLQNVGDGVFVNAYAHISQEHYIALSRHSIESGDLVIAALGETLPRACLIPSTVGPAIVKADCIRFKPADDVALATFLNFALNSEGTRNRTSKIVHGVGRPRLNQQEIKGIALPLPPLAEQRRIVAEVERRLSVIQQAEATVEVSLARAERLRQSILKQAFSGKLVPQDPNDEPASVLLERIRAEREAEAQAKGTGKGKSGNRKAKAATA